MNPFCYQFSNSTCQSQQTRHLNLRARDVRFLQHLQWQQRWIGLLNPTTISAPSSFNSRNLYTSLMTWKKQTACPRSSRAVLNFLTIHRGLTTAPINVQWKKRATTCVISLWLRTNFHSSSFWAADFTRTKRPDNARRPSTIESRFITATTLAIGEKPTLKQDEKNMNAGVLPKPVIVEFHTRINCSCEYKNAIKTRDTKKKKRWPRTQNKELIIQKTINCILCTSCLHFHFDCICIQSFVLEYIEIFDIQISLYNLINNASIWALCWPCNQILNFHDRFL